MNDFNIYLETTNVYMNKDFKQEEYKNQEILSLEKYEKAKKEITSWNGYKATSLFSLTQLAKQEEVNKIYYKDESTRFGLKSFKALGGAYAVANILIEKLKEKGINVDSKDLISKKYIDFTSKITVACATDGNHGKSVAWGADLFGCNCNIYIHSHVSENRKKEIEKFNAKVLRINGNYDDSVKFASNEAQNNGYIIVSDTSYEGYTSIPKDVMQGYTVMVKEAIEQMDEKPTHIFLQGGVGGMAAAVISVFHELYGKEAPKFIIVEPNNADCLLQSAKNSTPTIVEGELETIMAGLSCGEVSLLAWEVLKDITTAFISISDGSIAKTMHLLKNSEHSIISGESAVAGLAGFLIISKNEDYKKQLQINKDSNILFFGTEGDTDEEIYKKLINEQDMQILEINNDLLLKQINELGNIGLDKLDGGRTRIALDKFEKEGRDKLVSWMKELNLDIQIDKIGNIIGTLNPVNENINKQPLVMGSHIDTVKNAGALDGCYGVLAGLSVIRAFREKNILPSRPISVIAFTNEEGVRYQPDMMGSLVMAGGLDTEIALNTVGTDKTILKEELEKIGYLGTLEPTSIKPYKYLELHIEQGPILEANKKEIGVVENLQGISWKEVTIEGKANHAGTTPNNMRFDALQAMALIRTFLKEYTDKEISTLATIGSLSVEPNVINVIPRKVTFTVDLRNPNEQKLEEIEKILNDYLKKLETEFSLKITTKKLARFEPVNFNESICKDIEESAKKLNLSYQRITSGAGHDAQMISRIAPSAMIFVPSKNGISHNPAEFTEDYQLINGAKVLLDVVLKNI